LNGRLRMLEEEDREDVEAAESFLLFRGRPIELKDEVLIAQYKLFMKNIHNETIRNFIQHHMDIRIVLASMRRKKRGLKAYPASIYSALSQWAKHIEKNWEDRSFRLSYVFPWLPEAQELLEKGRALEFDRLLMSVVWDGLDRFRYGKDFEIEEVFSFIFKWNILNRWLAHEAKAAGERFEELLREVTSEHEEIFR